MLNYAGVTLSNPKKPELPTVNAMALVVQDDMYLIVSAAMVQLLQLDVIEKRNINVYGVGAKEASYVGPLQVKCADRTAFTGAIVAGTETVIGASLARELGLDLVSAPASVPSNVMAAAPALQPNPYIPPVSATPLKTGQPAKAEPVKPEPVPIEGLAQIVAPIAPESTHDKFPRQPTYTTENAGKKILQVPNFIDAATCKSLCDYARAQKKEQIGVVDHTRTTSDKLVSKVDTKLRDTQRVLMDDDMVKRINDIFFKAFAEHVEPYFQLEIDRWEKPQYLYYKVGGQYGAHADAEYWHRQPDGTGFWRRGQDRDISMLLYLNDDFTGGELEFPNQGMKLRPSPGLLVAFPSTNEYRHGALPTESGERFVIVTWSAAANVPRVRDHLPYGTLMMKDFRKGPAPKFAGAEVDKK